MKKNAGYSLVELIVAIAVFAIAGIAAFGFATFGTNNFKKSTVEVSLQYEQQIAVNQVRDLILESSNALYFDASSNTLVIYGQSYQVGDDKKYPVTKIIWNEAEERLYYGQEAFDSVSDIAVDFPADNLLAEYVSDFSVDLTKVKQGKVEFSMTFFLDGKEQKVVETVVLRNDVVVSNDVDTLYKGDDTFKDSFVESIVIKRGDTVFSYGGTDTIGKQHNTVNVLYEAQITTTAESEREYSATWRLGDGAPAGVTVDADTGVVSVAQSVPESSTFTLHAACREDATKNTYITITIVGGGVYPSDATVSIKDIKNGNGYKEYVLLPTLYYDNGTASNEPELFEWYIAEALPEGCYFNKETCTLIATENAEGMSFTVYGISKSTSAAGERLRTRDAATTKDAPKDLVITVTDVPKYSSGPSIKIVCNPDLQRAGITSPTVVFENATHTNYRYDWKIEPFVDATSASWDSGHNNVSFDLVTLSESRKSVPDVNEKRDVKHELRTEAKARTVVVNCAERLYWKDTFKVKVTVTATENVTGGKTPEVLVAEPVYLVISPVSFEFAEISNGFQYDPTCPTGDFHFYKEWEGDGKCCRTYKPKSTTGFYLAADTWFQSWGGEVQAKAVFYGADGTLTAANVNPQLYMHSHATAMTLGMESWMMQYKLEHANPKPVRMQLHFYIRDGYGNTAADGGTSYGNEALSNVFTYNLYYTEEEAKAAEKKAEITE